MIIKHYNYLSGAKAATGLTVIVDVFRACSAQVYAFAFGAERLFPVAQISDAWALKQHFSNSLTMGERGGIRIPGFDLGNSPSRLAEVDIKGKVLIHTTQAGTQGLALAQNAEEVITGSFVNAKAIARYILEKQPRHLSIVAMGTIEGVPAREDALFSTYLEALLTGNKPMEDEEMVSIMRQTDGQKFFNPALQDSLPEADFDFCTRLNQFDFVLQRRTAPEGFLELKKIDIDY